MDRKIFLAGIILVIFSIIILFATSKTGYYAKWWLTNGVEYQEFRFPDSGFLSEKDDAQLDALIDKMYHYLSTSRTWFSEPLFPNLLVCSLIALFGSVIVGVSFFTHRNKP